MPLANIHTNEAKSAQALVSLYWEFLPSYQTEIENYLRMEDESSCIMICNIEFPVDIIKARNILPKRSKYADSLGTPINHVYTTPMTAKE